MLEDPSSLQYLTDDVSQIEIIASKISELKDLTDEFLKISGYDQLAIEPLALDFFSENLEQLRQGSKVRQTLDAQFLQATTLKEKVAKITQPGNDFVQYIAAHIQYIDAARYGLSDATTLTHGRF